MHTTRNDGWDALRAHLTALQAPPVPEPAPEPERPACTIDGCDEEVGVADKCRRHYQRDWQRKRTAKKAAERAAAAEAALAAERPRGVIPPPTPEDIAAAPAEWTLQALCAQTDPEVWFPEKGGNPRLAIEICGRCPVRDRCLEEAMRIDGNWGRHYRHGVWGGLTVTEREALAKTSEVAA